MDLFFHKHIEPNENTISFNQEESKHLSKVLRKQLGDEISVTDGKGLELKVELKNINSQKCNGVITKIINHPQPTHKIHIAIAPTKNINRFEWFLEKATEIGIFEITPILCKYSERKIIKAERLNKIIKSALKQSQQFHLPQLNNLISFEAFVSQQKSGYIAHCHNEEKPFLADLKTINNSNCILIGPEGDFSTQEIAFAKKNMIIPISLGNQRLRTETAALIACHTLSLLNRNIK